MRILKVIGIGVGAFIGLMLLFYVLETIFGHDATSQISQSAGNLITIFIGVAVVVLIIRFFKKKKAK